MRNIAPARRGHKNSKWFSACDIAPSLKDRMLHSEQITDEEREALTAVPETPEATTEYAETPEATPTVYLPELTPNMIDALKAIFSNTEIRNVLINNYGLDPSTPRERE